MEIPIHPILVALADRGADIREPDLNGRWNACRCPFHDDRQASASISLTGFNCHACSIKGDAISLIMEMEGVDFAGAVARAADILGVSEEAVSGIPDSRRRRRPISDDDPIPIVGQRKLFSSRRRKRPTTGA